MNWSGLVLKAGTPAFIIREPKQTKAKYAMIRRRTEEKSARG
jgi:hypothetical protein